ncbi:hypothetical protein I8J30_24705 [Paenibacillus sp. DLE-14]|uniref:Uncharacterized protein n=1 Tax=Paenibacillus lignilyticus TaxID=1172615 RepID=A0ABS5CJ62_9BACL|nr:hypothetical protein [Paenibacillus lignilyticus]
MRTAVPGATAAEASSPAATELTTRSVAGVLGDADAVSALRTAKPSSPDRAKGGQSVVAVIASASRRPAACRSGTSSRRPGTAASSTSRIASSTLTARLR